MSDLEGWPFNKNAISAMISLVVMLAGCGIGATYLVIVGAWITATACTHQICLVIKEART